MRAALFPAWEGCRESRDIPGAHPGLRDAMGCTNTLGSLPITCQGADASRDPADAPGKTRPLSDSLLPRGLPRNDLSQSQLCSKQDF